ncbi:SGNH/GDSL hydrolase family protein [Priestia megaterium]|uniref:SGNH/GDSL hydrolase family protein n=1 Tax=Priestia megaterium TaxID=1404 RepID=UPI003D97BC50
MASNKTPNLGLDIWQPDDFFKRAEVNGNFTKVDDKIGALSESVKRTFSDLNRAYLYQKLVELNISKGKVGMIGDSITEGNANNGHPWYEYITPLFPNINFINLGHGGKTTEDFLTTYMSEVKGAACNLYVIALGCNDVRYVNDSGSTGAKTAAQYVTNMSNIINQCKSVGADIVVINPWATTWSDYKQTMNKKDMDQAFFEYTKEMRSYCATNLIPFIETTPNLKMLLNDMQAVSSWNLDGVHPIGGTGTKLYSYEVLYGNQKREDYIGKPYKAQGKYIYKLEILGHIGDAFDRVALQNLFSDATIIDIFGNSNYTGYNDPSGLKSAYSSSYKGYINLNGGFPFNVTFSTNTPISLLKVLPSGFLKGIGDFRLHQSNDPYAIANPLSDTWRVIHEDIGSSYFKRILYQGGGKPAYFYKIVINSAFDASGVVNLKSMSFFNEVYGYWIDTGHRDQPIEHLFDTNAKSVQFSTFPVTITVATTKPSVNFSMAFNNGLAVKDYEIWQTQNRDAMTSSSSTSWVKTRSGSATSTADFVNVSLDTRFDPYTLSQQNAPSQLGGTEDLATTQTKINSLIIQLKAANILK